MRKTKEPESKSEAFSRFEDLARKVVSVPKAEADRQREKHEREKGKRPATK